jgi:hypothetical protein
LVCRHHRTPLAFIGTAVLFLPLFVFLPRLIRFAMKADTDAVLDAFGKNEQIKKVFWPSAATAGLVLTRVVDPATAERIARMIAGIIPSTSGRGMVRPSGLNHEKAECLRIGEGRQT